MKLFRNVCNWQLKQDGQSAGQFAFSVQLLIVSGFSGAYDFNLGQLLLLSKWIHYVRREDPTVGW